MKTNMKRTLFPLLLAVALTARFNDAYAQSTDGKVTYTVSTVNYNGGYDPKHVSVVWLVDGSGTFVKTLCRHAGTRINYLYQWIASRGSYTTVDGTTGATIATQPQTHTVTWDCRNTSGQVAPNGPYTFRAEYTSSNAQGPYMASNCQFTKGTTAVTTNFPNFSNASGQFTGMSLTYTPYNEVAVTGLTPNSGTINSNVAVVVTVSNQTLNPLTFNVALSNVTSGTLISTLPVNALAANAVTNMTFSWSTAGLTANPYQIRAVASKLATETNVANNVFTGTITLSSQTAGDIAVTGVTPSTGVIDSTVPLRVTVVNKTASATGPFSVTLPNLLVTSVTSFSNAWRVAASANDAEESTGSTVDLASTDLELVVDTATQTVGLRYPELAIPKNAAISSAFIQFTDKTGENLNTDPISLTIRGQAADTALIFASTALNISSRPNTAASVSWVPPTWADAAAGPDQRTPDLKSIVQEIVNRSGWASGNAMAFKITGSGSRRAWAYDGSTISAPQLIVQWTTTSSLILTQQVANLASLATTNLTFSWNTAGVTAGVYQVAALAGPLASETFTADNSLTNAVTLRAPLHDLAVSALTVASMVPPNVVTNVTVAVTNRGDVSETFTHTLRDVTASPIVVGTRVVTNLAAYASTNLVFAWNTATNASFALGTHTLQAGIAPVAGETDLLNNTNQLAVIVASGLTTNALIAKSAVWKYMDKGLDLSGAPWQTADYFDGFWATGAAPLGYGLANIATAIGYGGVSSNRYVTAYFRREFTMDFTPLSVTGRVQRTHGVVLYLNGVEIARQNMPAGTPSYATLASGTVSGASATNTFGFAIDPSRLVLGRNLLTAELHLAAATNTTAGFALELSTVTPAIPAQPRVATVAVDPDGTVQSGDTLGVLVELVNSGNASTACIVLIRDAVTGAILATQSVATLVPGESSTVRLTVPTFGAATGARTLQALTVINGVTNTTQITSAPVTLSAPDFSPRKVSVTGSIGGRCSAVAVSGSTVYLGCGSTLEVWDATVPTAPVRIGALRLPGVIEDLAAANGWVYAAAAAAGVQIVDASQPAQPLHRATFDSSGFARRVTLDGNLLYVADALGGVRVLNVASPAAPTLAGAYQTAGPAQTVAFAAPRLLVLDGQNGLQNLHAANPAAMSVTGTLSRLTAGLALAPVSGGALVSDANSGLYRVSLANPAVPTVTTNALLPSAGRGLATSGTALYVAAGPAGLLTLNATTLATLGTTAVGDEAYDVAVAGTTLYVAAGFAGCQSLNISSPLAPAPLGVFSTGARPVDAAASGSTLYVAAAEGGLQVHSLQNLALPTLLGYIPSLTNPRCVTVDYPNLFVADGIADLKIFNIADPEAPALLGSYTSSALSHIRRISVAGTQAVITDGRVLQVLSVANPAAPTLQATVTNAPGSFVFDVATVGNQAYAACGNAGLRIYGLDNGLALDNVYATPGPATGVSSTSNLLHVACGPSGWLTLSIAANPVSPVLVKATASGMTFGAASAGPLVYLTDGARVGQALNVSAPLTPIAVTNVPTLTLALRVKAVQGLLLTAEDEAGLAILSASPGDLNLSGIPDSWEQQIVSASTATNGPIRSVLDVDPQAVGPNGFPYYQSYLAGLTPTDPNSVLAISSATSVPTAGGQFVVQWQSVPGIRYVVQKSTNLTASAAGFLPVSPVITATSALSAFTNAVSTGRAYYMITVAP